MDDHYRPNDEFHRKLYAEKAMAFLGIETATPTEQEKRAQMQDERIKALESELNLLKKYMTVLRAKFMDGIELTDEELPDLE